MHKKPIILLAVYNSLIAALVLYIYSFYQVNPILFNMYTVLVAVVAWVILFKLPAKAAYGLLAASWVTLGVQYYYLGYSGQDIATSLGQQSENIMLFNFVIGPIAVIVTLVTVLLIRRSKV